MSAFGGPRKLKKACEKRKCLQLEVGGGSMWNPVFDETWTAEEIFKRALKQKIEGTELEKESGADVKWDSWVKKQMALKRAREVNVGKEEKDDGEEEVGREEVIDGEVGRVEDLGFASTRRNTPFPALIMSRLASGAKKVAFFATNEVVLVSESNWIPFSETEASNLAADAVINRGGFSAALSQLRAFKDELEGRGQSGDAALAKVWASKGRHLAPVTARALGEDEAFNQAAFSAKMFLGEDDRWTVGN